MAGLPRGLRRYSHKLVPQIGKAIAHDADSYRYLIESIRRFRRCPSSSG
jgi:demethylmenaquinone methyltransferase/2-methoxy-6-polyprenyl-1,4-benzoquinol methylase